MERENVNCTLKSLIERTPKVNCDNKFDLAQNLEYLEDPKTKQKKYVLNKSRNDYTKNSRWMEN